MWMCSDIKQCRLFKLSLIIQAIVTLTKKNIICKINDFITGLNPLLPKHRKNAEAKVLLLTV